MTTNNTPIEAEIEAAAKAMAGSYKDSRFIREQAKKALTAAYAVRVKQGQTDEFQQQLANALGCDVSAVTVENVVAIRDALKEYVGVVTSSWNPDSWTPEAIDGGHHARTALAPLEKKGV